MASRSQPKVVQILKELRLETTAVGQRILEKSAQLADHALYHEVKGVEDVRIFMGFHVWCVWDFMSLAKAVQLGVGHYAVPWVPPADASLVAWINEIISGEEADVGPDGAHASHLEIYLAAMRETGARTSQFSGFIERIRRGEHVREALGAERCAPATTEFVSSTLRVAQGPLHGSVAAFCLGREELVPRMFATFLKNLPKDEPHLKTFLWYLNRHVELDNESHGPVSVRLFERLIGTEPARLDEALNIALQSISARGAYLDATMNFIRLQRAM